MRDFSSINEIWAKNTETSVYCGERKQEAEKIQNFLLCHQGRNTAAYRNPVTSLADRVPSSLIF